MKLVIFDYDGVLMDTFQFTRLVYQDLSREFNLNLPSDPKFFRELLELDFRETLKKLNLTSQSQLKRDEEIFTEGLKKYERVIKPYDGILDVLEVLSTKFTLAVVTNNFRSELNYRLKKFGLNKYFSGYFAYGDGLMKPNPDLLLKCLKKFKITPEEAAFIGDMHGDIICGRAAKLGKVIGVTYGYHTRQRLLDSDIIVDEPRELINIFK